MGLTEIHTNQEFVYSNKIFRFVITEKGESVIEYVRDYKCTFEQNKPILFDKDFKLKKTDKFSSPYAKVYNISNREVNKMVKEYRKLYPNDKRSKQQLSLYAINTLMVWKMNRKDN